MLELCRLVQLYHLLAEPYGVASGLCKSLSQGFLYAVHAKCSFRWLLHAAAYCTVSHAASNGWQNRQHKLLACSTSHRAAHLIQDVAFPSITCTKCFP